MNITIQEVKIGRKQVFVVDCDDRLTTGMPCLLLNEAVSSVLERRGHRILINLQRVRELDYFGREALADAYVNARDRNALLRVDTVTFLALF